MTLTIIYVVYFRTGDCRETGVFKDGRVRHSAAEAGAHGVGGEDGVEGGEGGCGEEGAYGSDGCGHVLMCELSAVNLAIIFINGECEHVTGLCKKLESNKGESCE